jgi:hypothetical protein
MSEHKKNGIEPWHVFLFLAVVICSSVAAMFFVDYRIKKHIYPEIDFVIESLRSKPSYVVFDGSIAGDLMPKEASVDKIRAAIEKYFELEKSKGTLVIDATAVARYPDSVQADYGKIIDILNREKL